MNREINFEVKINITLSAVSMGLQQKIFDIYSKEKDLSLYSNIAMESLMLWSLVVSDCDSIHEDIDVLKIKSNDYKFVKHLTNN